jgi:hypothetical protein
MTPARPPAPAPSAPGPTHPADPRRLVTGAKLATLVASAVGFGAIAGLVIANPAGARATAPAPSAQAAGTATQAAGTATQATPAATQAADFFAVPPGFVQPPMVDNGAAGRSGTSGTSGSQGGFGNQGGFGGQMPGMRSGGS